ncbi:MAG: sterol desaturase family protein [Candidatus Binatia bacterium]|nr:sterol desaturase family protein [Candidatus Binatia bacterium]
MMNAESLNQTIAQVAPVALGATFLYLPLELLLVHFRNRDLKLREARACGLGVLSGGVVGGVLGGVGITLGILLLAEGGAALSPIEGGFTWPWWIFGWVVYEFWYWVQHWGAHKVRFLWCMHSPHHAPRSMHMLVGANHHFAETIFYFPVFMGFFPALCGVPPLMCVAINLVDVVYGSFLHISDDVVRRGRYGVLERFLQTPAHHRVHHGRNARYMDTNYNSITLLWDWLLGTLQPLRDDDPVQYGITRDVDTGGFVDLHFGEFRLLWRDVRGARSWRERLGYLFRPPGWAPDGNGKTVADVKRALAGADEAAAL